VKGIVAVHRPQSARVGCVSGTTKGDEGPQSASKPHARGASCRLAEECDSTVRSSGSSVGPYECRARYSCPANAIVGGLIDDGEFLSFMTDSNQ
jgi:hypothetical protein